MKKQKVMTNDVEMSFIDEGTGKPIVLLHGFCGSSMYWQKVIPKLALHYRVIAPDLRGHGDSSAPEGPYAMEAMANDIFQLLDRLQISKVSLFGHSLGGYVTLAFAEQYPDRLDAFGLVHSTALPDDEAGKTAREKSIRTIEKSGMEPFLMQLIPKLFAPTNFESMREAVGIAESIGLKTNPDGAIATLQGMKNRPDRTKLLAASELPVLLVAGKDDQLIPPAKTFTLQAPHIQTRELEGTGHMSMLENPGQLMESIMKFLR